MNNPDPVEAVFRPFMLISRFLMYWMVIWLCMHLMWGPPANIMSASGLYSAIHDGVQGACR